MERLGAWHRPDSLGHRDRLLGAGDGHFADPLLDVGGPLGRATCPVAQAPDLPCLGEDEQREDRDPDHRGATGDQRDLV